MRSAIVVNDWTSSVTCPVLSFIKHCNWGVIIYFISSFLSLANGFAEIVPLDGYYYSQSYLLQTLYKYGLVCCATVFYFHILFMCIYYMTTIVRALWLAAERARFPCNERALLLLLSKPYTKTWYWTSMLWSIDSCQKRYLLTSVVVRWPVFLKLSAD